MAEQTYHIPSRLREEPDKPPPPTAPAKPVLTLKELPDQTGRRVPTDFYYVDPNSVENDWLMFFGKPINPIGIDVWVYELNRSVVPKWFGVAVPPGLTEFTRPHVFFHPTPGQAGYNDKDYPTLTGKWRASLVGYIQRMGSQIVSANRKQVLIMPFLTEGATETLGIFAAEWHAIVTEILAQLTRRYSPASRSPQITDLVTSSFSAGVKYMHSFLTKGARVKELIRECYDFDGRYSKPYRHLCERLKVTGTMTVVNYDQGPVRTIEEVRRDALGGRGVHVPLPRWEKFKDTPRTQDDVHAAITRHMMRHAMARSKVG
jgi:hypothetical protein